MKKFNLIIFLIQILLPGLFIINPQFVLADQGMLPNVRVFYRADGGVSITYFLVSSCGANETETQCMDRISNSNTFTNELLYDDIPRDQVPINRTHRDKWRGEKGKGIWVDNSLVTKSEKLEEFQNKLDEEFNKDNPDTGKILKLQHQLEKAKEITHAVLTQDDLAQFEEKQKSFIASTIEAIGDVFANILNGIKNGFLALKNLVVGTPEQPSGITTYDHDTGKPYCVIVKSGKLETIPGECGAPSEPSPSDTNQPSNQVTNQPSDDTEPPTITLNGANPAQVEVGSTYSDLGAAVTDNVSQNLGYKVSLDSGPEIYPNELVIDTSTAGEHTITYTATDQAGNTGTATRQVIVSDPNANSEPPAESQP